MKKVLLVALCVLTLVCLCACDNNSYKKMDKAVSAEYSTIKISVEAKKGTDKLMSTIDVSNKDGKSTVVYHLENFTEISADSIPDSYITVREGTVEIANGTVSGDKLADVDFTKATRLPYTFHKSFFDDANFNKGVFTASVAFPRLFTGNNSLVSTNMTVTFSYEAAEKVLVVSYEAKGVDVKITYTMS